MPWARALVTLTQETAAHRGMCARAMRSEVTMQRAMFMGKDRIEVRPTSGALGAVIAGVYLSLPLAPAEVVQLRSALNEHGVICFSDQRLMYRITFEGVPLERGAKALIARAAGRASGARLHRIG